MEFDSALWITQTAQREPNVAFSESHAAAVTRTEVNAVCNLAAMDAAYRQGKRFKTWKTFKVREASTLDATAERLSVANFSDSKVRPSHKAANGQRVPLDMPFTVGGVYGYKMMFPNDTSLGAPAGEVVNCWCVLEFDDASTMFAQFAQSADTMSAHQRQTGGKVLTNSDEHDIMRVGSDNVALEYQRYGRNKSTLVNKTYIESGEYRRKFDNATNNPEVNKALYNAVKAALKHRSGTELEDMYWFDGKTGELLAKEINNTVPRQVDYSNSTKRAVNSAIGKSLITLHTHPSSMPPSVGDLNSCFNHGYECGYIACHDGKVFGYTAYEQINEKIYDLYIKNGINDGLSEFDAQIAALNKMKLRFKIDFWEVD